MNSLRKSGNSTGAIIEIIAENVPKGIGSPIYKKLDSQIAEGLMSINAVKGVEIGSGSNQHHLLEVKIMTKYFQIIRRIYF